MNKKNDFKLVKHAYKIGLSIFCRMSDMLGVTKFLAKTFPRARYSLWFRSLFAIHNLERLVELDLPWWNFKAIDEIENFIDSRMNVKAFEFGSGASTVWLSKRCDDVRSVEHDHQWFLSVLEKVNQRENVHIKHILFKSEVMNASKKEQKISPEYSESILSESGLFDLIVIDGRDRVNCFKNALKKIQKDGIIIFDNSSRKRYQAAFQNQNIIIKRYFGLTVCLPYPDETAIISLPNQNSMQ